MTILLGACGWGVVHVVDRVGGTPAVEYCVEWGEPHDGKRSVELAVRNLSFGTLLSGLELNLGSRDEAAGKFSGATIQGDPPAFQDEEPPRAEGSEVSFHIRHFHPGARFRATAEYDGRDEPEFRLHSSDSGVLLLECSTFTWLIRHELVFIVLFSIVSIGLVLLLLVVRDGDEPNA